MSDETENTESTETEEVVETTEEESAEDANEETEKESPQDEDDSEDESTDDDDDEPKGIVDLESALKVVEKLRRSEAKYRVENKDLKKRYADAKTPQEIEEITKQVNEESAAEARALLAENVALKAGLPASFADRLKGSTREELEADAKVFAKLMPAVPTEDPDLEGGLEGAGDNEDTFDEEAARKANRAMRNRPY